MKDIERILELWSEAERAGEAGVLATVVKTQGSSYRAPGGRMLLTTSGRRAGSVSGGCLESDLIQKAWWFTEKGPVVRRYDTTPDGEIADGGYGLGCSGIIHLLLERITPQRCPVMSLLREVRVRRQPAGMAHIIDPTANVGESIVIDSTGEIRDNIADSQLRVRVKQELRAAVEAGESAMVRIDGVEAFLETVAPPVRLLIFGAGDDAVPMSEAAKFLGWQVAVSDSRAHYARRDKFPEADEVHVRESNALTGPDIAGDWPVDPWTVAVLMSHSYSQDVEVLRQLRSLPLSYVGILGPRRRTEQVMEEAGVRSDELTTALHGPMGLDIGADGPEQVALAVTAEIQAVLHGRSGGFLRQRSGSIHSAETGESEARAGWIRPIVCA